MPRWEAVCRRCGRETPALSDCGGFYDLAPQAVPPAPVKDRKKNGWLGLLCAVLAVALVVSIAACVALSNENQELEEELEELQDGPSATLDIGKDLPPIPKVEGEDVPQTTGNAEAVEETIPDTEE